MSETGEAAAGPDAGATLLEMLVVTALLAMTSGLVFAGVRPALTRYRLDAARAEVASAVAFARARAIRTGEAQTLAVDADGAGLSGGGGRRALPSGVRLAPASASMRFSPEGAVADSRSLVVSDGRARLALQVEAGSGLVRVVGGAS